MKNEVLAYSVYNKLFLIELCLIIKLILMHVKPISCNNYILLHEDCSSTHAHTVYNTCKCCNYTCLHATFFSDVSNAERVYSN